MISALALAHPNIAFIKYWGNRDQDLRIPSTGSISMNLAGLFTRTQVTFDPGLSADELILGGERRQGAVLERVSAFLNIVRRMADIASFALVDSQNNFPTGTGIASSASAFAALSLAASQAAGLSLDDRQLSRLARRGSGSACRSVPAGFVEWYAGQDDQSSYAASIAPPEHWDLVDCVAIVSQQHKATGSEQGHTLADTSPLQAARVQDAPRRLEQCRQAIRKRDFEALADAVELDSNLMHAVMMTSHPRLLYWLPASLMVMQTVQAWRIAGLPTCYTVDAGPNVHVLAPASAADEVEQRLRQLPGVFKVFTAHPGQGAHLVEPGAPKE
jgi:diphosphomevalonate decarboxylase